MKSLGVVLISYNSKDYTLRCLAPLMSLGLSVTVKICVVDNASSDQSASSIARQFPEVRLIRNSWNKGFGMACNQAVRALGSVDALLFVNPDTEPDRGVIQGMWDYLEAHPDVGAAGPWLKHADGRRQHSFANWPTRIKEFFPKRLLAQWNPGRYPFKSATYSEPLKVESLIGAFFIMPYEAFSSAGGFDERYTFYLEETDLCRKLVEKNFRVMFLPQFEVVHHQGVAAKQKELWSRYQYYRSLYQFLIKWSGKPACLIVYLKNLCAWLLKLICYGVLDIASLCRLKGMHHKLRKAGCLFAGHLHGFSPWPAPPLQNFSKSDEHPLYLTSEARKEAGLCSALQTGTWPNVKLIKQSSEALTFEICIQEISYVVKMHLKLSFFRRLRLGPYGKRIHEHSEKLHRAGVYVPQSLGYGYFKGPEGTVGWGHISRSVPDVRVLNFFDMVLNAHRDSAKQTWSKQKLIGALGKWVRRLHDKGIFHHDLKASNIMLQYTLDQGSPSFYLVDLEKVSFGFFTTGRLRTKNLVQLSKSFPREAEMTGRERVRFLWHYATPSERKDRTGFRKLNEKVDAWAQKIIHRKESQEQK